MPVLTLESCHPLPLQGAIRTNPAGFAQLAQWYGRGLLLRDQPVLLDLTGLTWLDANQCALWGAMLHDLQMQRGLSFCVDGEVVRQRFGVLLQNGFLADPTAGLWSGNSTTSVQMRAFDVTDSSAFLNYISNGLFQQPDMGTACTQAEQDDITSHLLEIFSNVKLHAETDRPLFACGQYYPRLRQLKISLVDLGRGYLGPIRDYTNRPQYQGTGGPILLAEPALRWALQGHNSSLPGRTGGLGLKLLRDYSIRRGGELHLVSDGCYLTVRRGANGQVASSAAMVPEFQGSAVHVVFSCC